MPEWRPPEKFQGIIGRLPAGLGIFLSLLILLPAIAHLYVGREAPCYWSDFNYYEWATRFSLDQLVQSPLTYPLLLLSSVSLQHNLYFTVPLAPIMAMLGGDRAAYISSILIMFFIPLTYCIALLAASLGAEKTDENLEKKSIIKAWATTLLIPVLWAPFLRGYPDGGAAATLLAALVVYLRGRTLSSCRRAALIGVLLALTVLLRRYMAFAGVSLVACIFVDQFLRARGGRLPLKQLLSLVGGGAATMVLLGFPFLQNLTKLNLGALYESYHVSPATSIAYFFSCFGLITLFLSASGFVLAWRSGIVERDKVIFVIAFFGLSQALWILGPGELGTHYTLYFSPLVALGMVLFFQSTRRLQPLAIAAVIFLGFNFYLSTAPALRADNLGIRVFRPGMLSYADQEGSGAGLLLSAGYPPNMRTDVETLKKIVEQLRVNYTGDKNGPQTDTNFVNRRGQVGVIGCSNLFNHEILRNVERSIYGLKNDRVPWLELPVVDSKDMYPLERLLACSYVLVPSENQYFVPPAGQSIMAGSRECFEKRWPLAEDFRLLPDSQTIDHGLKISIYKRIRPTSPATAARTLALMKSFTPVEPGSQPDWLTTGQMSLICYDKKRSEWKFDLTAERAEDFDKEDRYILYCRDLPQAFNFSGKIKSTGSTPTLLLRSQILAEDGSLILEKNLGHCDAGADFDWSQKFESNKSTRAKYLALIVDGPVGVRTFPQGSAFTLTNLQVEATTP